MYEWQKQIQIIVDEIDSCIKSYQDEALTLRTLSQKLGYSEYYTTRKFKEISGMKLREYLLPVSYTHLDVYKRQSLIRSLVSNS